MPNRLMGRYWTLSAPNTSVNSNQFGVIASQMGDTAYRGKILWMLLTARPDLLPIDLKRQGRAEEHIALFYPETAEDRTAMLKAMLKILTILYLLITWNNLK